MRKITRAFTVVGLGLSPVAGFWALHGAVAAPVILFNLSPSEPVGLYRLTAAAPGVGALVAFRVPAPGRAYAEQHIRYVTRGGILKEIAAGPGSVVCETDVSLFIDGRRRGAITEHDRRGDELPHWRGCHRLNAGELFAFSNRIPNSFDSRYYGPVEAKDVMGVYAPIWTK